MILRFMPGSLLVLRSKNEVIAMLKCAGFNDIRVNPKEESKFFIKDWVLRSGAENYVVSADIQAVKN